MSYLQFIEIENKGKKTKIFEVYNKDMISYLGQIKWYGAWRQYCFESNLAIYDRKCMKEIIEFIDNLMEERKNAK